MEDEDCFREEAPVYSERYEDDYYQYRHVLLPKQMKNLIKPEMLLSEEQWRNIGVVMSRGWEHFMCHKPEPHVLIFRRPLGCDPATGMAPDGWSPPPGEKDPWKPSDFDPEEYMR